MFSKITKAIEKHIVEEIKDFCSTNPNVKSISVFGLTYKPNIDDIRESPAFEIYSSLIRDSGCKISAVDPYLENGELQNQVDFISSKEAIEKTDLLILLVPHSEFKNLFNFLSIISKFITQALSINLIFLIFATVST